MSARSVPRAPLLGLLWTPPLFARPSPESLVPVHATSTRQDRDTESAIKFSQASADNGGYTQTPKDRPHAATAHTHHQVAVTSVPAEPGHPMLSDSLGRGESRRFWLTQGSPRAAEKGPETCAQARMWGGT